MLPVKEESPADAGISDVLAISVPREPIQSTPPSTLTSNSQHLKREGDDMREPPSVAAATVASPTVFSDSGALQRSWSSTDPSHPFANAVARGYRTYVIVADGLDERPAPEAIDERTHQHTRESSSPRTHGASYYGTEQHYAQRHELPYAGQYQEQCREQFGRYEEQVYEHSHQDATTARRRPYERSFQQDLPHTPGRAYDAVHEAAYDVAHNHVDEHIHESRQELDQEHARGRSETRHPRRIPPLVVFERLAATMSEPSHAPLGQASETQHAEVPNHRAGGAPYDAMEVDTPEPADAMRISTPVLSSSPSTRNSMTGDSEPSAGSSAPSSTSPPAQHTPSDDESAHDTIATRRPFRMARQPKPTMQPVQPSPTRATRQATKPTENSPGKSAVKLASKPASPTPAKTAAKALAKSSSRRASAPIERRATRLSGILPDNILPSSPLGKRRRRVSERDALSSVPRELRRLQDTKEFAHVDDNPVIYTVWSNGRYVPANAAGEPLLDKTKTAKADKTGQNDEPATPAEGDEEGSPEAPKPAQKRIKAWLSKGLYAGQSMPTNHAAGLTTAEKKALAKLPELSKPYPRNKTLPMPIYNGLRMLIQGRDFKMPYDVFHPLPPGQPKPVKYGKMSKNRFVGEAHAIWKKSPNYDDFQSKCVCKTETGCDEDCQNRIMLYECNDSICNVGAELCNNREFQRLAERSASKNPYHIGVEVFKTPNRGHGIRASRSFRPGQIIMEYIGEIITEEESDRRMNELYKDNECYYLMSFDQSLIIDGTSGSVARFVNHSCSPNCRMIKWLVSGQPRIALFAGDRPIMSGEELTYDYNFDPYSSKNVQRCLCGSENCRGVLGPRKSEKMTKAAAAEKAAAEAAAAAKAKAKMTSAAGKLGKRKRDAEETADSGNSTKKMRATASPLQNRGRPTLDSASSKVKTTKAALEALAAEAAKQARAAKAAKAKKAKRAAAKAAEAAKAEKAKKATAKSGTLDKNGKTSAAATKVFKTTNKKTKAIFTKKSATTAASSSAAKLGKGSKATKQLAKRAAEGTIPTKGTKNATVSKTMAVASAGKRAKMAVTGVGESTAAKAKATTRVNKAHKDPKITQKRGPKLKMASDVLRTSTAPILEPIVNEARSTATHATPMAKALAAKAAKRATEAAEVPGPYKVKPTKVAKLAKNGVVKPIRATAPVVGKKLPHPALKAAQPPAQAAVATAMAPSPDLTNVPVKRGRGRPRLTPEDLAKRAAKAAAKAAKIAESKAKTAAARLKTDSTTITMHKADALDMPMADVSGEEQELALQFLNDTAIAHSVVAATTKSPSTKAVAAALPLSSPLPGTEAPRRKRGRPRKVVAEAVSVDVSFATMDTTISSAV